MNLVLSVGIGTLSTQTIHSSLEQYPRKRDLHHINGNDSSIYQIYNIISASLNVSLVGSDFLEQSSQAIVYLYTPLTAAYANSLESLSNKFLGNVTFHQQLPNEHGFVYCSHQTKLGEELILSLLRQTADYGTWVALATTCLLVAAVSTYLNDSSFLESLLGVFTPLLSQSISNNIKKKLKRSILFLWLLFSAIFQRLIDGSMTMSLTVPPPDRQFQSFSDLPTNNYKLLLTDDYMCRFYLNLVMHSLSQSNDIDKADLSALKRLLENAVLTGSKEKWPQMIVTRTDKYSRAGVLSAVNRLGIRIKTLLLEKQRNGEDLKRRCYAIKYNLRPSILYNAVVGPKYRIIRIKLSKIIESGIYAWWEQESLQVLSTVRVQDRNRICRNGVVCDDAVDGALSLGLEDRIVNVFYLWMILLGLALGLFMMEYLQVQVTKPRLSDCNII